jgi:hypothetical protein
MKRILRVFMILCATGLVSLMHFAAKEEHESGFRRTPVAQRSVATVRDKVVQRVITSVRFVKNEGRYPSDVRYTSRIENGIVAFYVDRIEFHLYKDVKPEHRLEEMIIPTAGHSSKLQAHAQALLKEEGNVITVRYPGSYSHVKLDGKGNREERVNEFYGRDQKKWKRNIETFDTLVYRNIYKGVDLYFYNAGNKLKYEFVIEKKTSYKCIRIAYKGMDSLTITNTMDLALHVNNQAIIEERPAVYQNESAGIHQLDASFILVNDTVVTYKISGINPHYPLIIDPVYSTLIGGNNTESINSIANINDSIIVLGISTTSSDLICIDGKYATYRGGYSDVYLVVLNIARNTIQSSSYFGGSEEDYTEAVFVHNSSIILIGGTKSPDLPITSKAIQKYLRGMEDCFIATFNMACNEVLSSTYYGGTGIDVAEDAVCDENGDIYLTGWTTSYSSFPITANAIQRNYQGGDDDAFITKIRGDGSALLYSSFLGGNGYDEARAISVTPKGRIVICGYTTSSNYPTIGNILQVKMKGAESGFISAIDSGGRSMSQSTYFGGSYNDLFEDVAVMSNGMYVFLGETTSMDLPVTKDAFQSVRGNQDPKKLSWDYSVLYLDSMFNTQFCSYLGGAGEEQAVAVITTPDAVLVSGNTTSEDFPVKYPLKSTLADKNITITIIKCSEPGIVMSTIWGGDSKDIVDAVSVFHNKIYLGGATYSTDYPLTTTNIKENRTGVCDGVMTILSFDELRLTQEEQLPACNTSLQVAQNNPNPFRTSTTIRYANTIADDIVVCIYDSRGRVIRRNTFMHHVPGNHIYQFERTDLKAGIYYYSISDRKTVVTRKMMVY